MKTGGDVDPGSSSIKGCLPGIGALEVVEEHPQPSLSNLISTRKVCQREASQAFEGVIAVR
jgi:hypothetical protein